MSRLASPMAVLRCEPSFVRRNFWRLHYAIRSGWRRVALTLLIALVATVQASANQTNIPPAEQLLPADTLLVISAPDATKLWAVLEKSPRVQFWRTA